MKKIMSPPPPSEQLGLKKVSSQISFFTSSANMADGEQDHVSNEIRECTRRKLQSFESIRNKNLKDVDLPFWDIVVVTAVDPQQRMAYELEIESKVDHGELPKGLIYKVVNDPSGTKIGNGGATLHAIKLLEKDHGSQFLSQCKVLMLHAGGFSQRLPSASVLGKIFTAVPYGKLINDEDMI